MPTFTVTAPDGVQLKVRLQESTEKPTVVVTQGFDEHGDPTEVKSFGPKSTVWFDKSIDTFASESRNYEVDAKRRILIEAQ